MGSTRRLPPAPARSGVLRPWRRQVV